MNCCLVVTLSLCVSLGYNIIRSSIEACRYILGTSPQVGLHNSNYILGACEKLRKAAFSCVMSVCHCVSPSVGMAQFGSNWTDFHEICIWIFLEFLPKM